MGERVKTTGSIQEFIEKLTHDIESWTPEQRKKLKDAWLTQSEANVKVEDKIKEKRLTDEQVKDYWETDAKAKAEASKADALAHAKDRQPEAEHARITPRTESEDALPTEFKKKMKSAIWHVGITVVLFIVGVYFFSWVPTIGVFMVYFYITLKGQMLSIDYRLSHAKADEYEDAVEEFEKVVERIRTHRQVHRDYADKIMERPSRLIKLEEGNVRDWIDRVNPRNADYRFELQQKYRDLAAWESKPYPKKGDAYL